MEEIKNLVSVIIPVYNADSYLRDMLNDLVVQSFGNMEIIIIDDGSTDGSAEIIQEYAIKDKRIQYIQTKNGGPSKARNLGLSLARGQYIRFIDADDRILPNSMQDMVEAFEKNSATDIVLGNYTTDIEKGFFTGTDMKEGIIDAKAFAEVFIKYMKTFYFGVPWNKLYKRDIIEKYKIRFNESIIWCEDFLFNVEYFSKCKKMFILNSVHGVYQYYTRETGITSGISKISLEEVEKIDALRYQRMQRYCAEYGLQEVFELEWKYAGLYKKLVTITRYFRNDTIEMKYQKFKQSLNEKDAYQYICAKCKETHYKIWYRLKEAYEKQSYKKVFLFFVMKGLQYKYMNKWFIKTEMGILERDMKKL